MQFCRTVPFESQAFFTGAVAVFAKHPRIEPYAWYPWNTNNERVASDGTLTSPGNVFAARRVFKWSIRKTLSRDLFLPSKNPPDLASPPILRVTSRDSVCVCLIPVAGPER